MKCFKFFVTVVFSLTIFHSQSQDLSGEEGELNHLLSILREAKNDTEKSTANSAFKAKLEEVIGLNGAFDYPFSQLKTLGSIKSPDNTFRLFNWNVENDDMTESYYCFVLTFDERTKKYKTIELKDNSIMLPQKPTEILEADNWYGALYYKIIPMKKGSKTVYTLLGWDGNNSSSTMKMIDVLVFSGGTVRLGSPIFKQQKETLKRVFFEFAEKTTMYLNYEEQYNRIIFDHLIPESPALKGLYSMYIPDLSYDAFVLENGKWYLKEDVIGVNKAEEETVSIEYIDDKTGELKERKIKNKWEEPSKSHVATTPEDQMKEEQSSPTEHPSTLKGSKKENRKNPQSYNPVNNPKKKKK